jgi:aminoglycoside 3-N-acetyltransferase
MVHSSVNGLAPMYDGNAMELLGALIDYVGPGRTLVMPAFNFGEYGGAGVRELLRKNPRFDLRRTPSQMGLLTELFRRSSGVVQSRHPAYRIAALGPLAEALTAGHEQSPGGLGPGTPFDYMAQHNAQIVGLGKSFQVMTQVHHVEGLLENEWPAPTHRLPELPVTIVERDRETDMLLGGLQQEWSFNIWKLRELLGPDELREWTFHHCPLFAARAGRVTDALVQAARRGFVLYDR